MIDRKPAFIIRCKGIDDVKLAITFARENELPLAVRGGGHSVAGYGVCDDGVVIDLSSMKAIEVNPEDNTARAEPGLNWGEFDTETQKFGLAVTGGLITDTGIAGLTLGGGLGWLMRRYGQTSDNLIEAELVTADNRIVIANKNKNSEL